jgi:hypothetical protein
LPSVLGDRALHELSACVRLSAQQFLGGTDCELLGKDRTGHDLGVEDP